MAEPKVSTLIEQALDLEVLDKNLFRSRQLWLPLGARGVYGGQIVGQAISAARLTIDTSRFQIHSLHAYFILSGDSSRPIIYNVSRIRDGKTYITRRVDAHQNGNVIFTLTSSFKRPEDFLLEHQLRMPVVPPPESLKSQEQQLEALLTNNADKLDPRHRAILMQRIAQPVSVDYRPVTDYSSLHHTYNPPKTTRQFIWMRAKGSLPDDLTSHQCVVAYCSDNYLLQTSVLAHGLSSYSNPRISMMNSLDHAMWFHAPFRADEWLLYEMFSTRTADGRGLTFGRIYSRDGKLVASCAQEGVVRVKYKEGTEPHKSDLRIDTAPKRDPAYSSSSISNQAYIDTQEKHNSKL